jgi:hypothetical protein
VHAVAAAFMAVGLAGIHERTQVQEQKNLMI